MSLRKRTALVILLTLCGLLGLLYGVARTILEDGFLSLEEREAHINVERVRNALDEQLNFIASKAQDWAVWDDTYKFVQDHNAAYLESNISDNTLSNLKIHMMIIANENNEIVTAIQNLNPDVPAMQAISPNIAKFLKAGSPFVTHSSNQDTHKGLVILPEGPLLLVSKPIVPTNIEGAIKGTMFFGRFVDAATISRLAEVTKLPLNARTQADAGSDMAFNQAFLDLTVDQPSRLQAADDQLLYGYTLFHDVYQKPALVFRVDMKREVLQQGRRTIEAMIIAIISAGIIFGLIIFSLLEKAVVSRILKLSRTVSSIGQSPDSGRRLEAGGRDEITVLATSVNGMLDTIEERNQTIRNIFDNISFGLFICDQNMTIVPGVTRSCSELFGRDAIEGQTLPQVLGISGDPAAWMLTIYQQVFDDFMPAEISLAQMRNKFLVQGRYIKLEGTPLKDAKGQVHSVLFSVADVSKLEEVERDNREHRTLVKILKAPQAFTEFLKEARCQFTEIREALKTKNTGAARRPLHTLKGNYSIFDLAEVVQAIHTIEEQDHFQNAEIDQLEAQTRKFLEKNRSVLQIHYDEPAEASYTLHESELAGLEQKLRLVVETSPQLVGLIGDLAQLRRKPVRELLGPIDELVNGLAQRLQKEVQLEAQGFDLKVDPQLIKPVVDILPHLIRNSLDHGIEESWARGNKPARGLLQIAFAELADGILVTVTDDGRGLNLEALTHKATTLGLLTATEAQQLSPAAQADLIFQDQVSTAASVSDISGRGIGMGAVKETIEKSGGHMRVINRPGQGLKIEMLLKTPTSTTTVQRLKRA